MTANYRLRLDLRDASRGAASLAPFAAYYVTYSAGAETV